MAPGTRRLEGGSARTSRRRAPRGQSLVEFALILPVLILALSGVFDLARIMSIHAATISASREGARYGAAAGSGTGGTSRYVDCVGIRAAARNATAALVTVSDAQIRVSHDDGAGTPRSQPCAPHGTGPVAGEIHTLDRVVVEVTVAYEPITPLVGQLIGPVTVVAVDRRTIVTEAP